MEGRCFDAARMGGDGKKAIRWQTLMLRCLVVAQRLMELNRDEGREMPALLAKARETVHEMAGRGPFCKPPKCVESVRSFMV